MQSGYFFDIVESDGILKFIPRANKQIAANITENELVTGNSSDLKETIEVSIAQELELPQKIAVTYLDQHRNYDNATIDAKKQITDSREQVSIDLPLLLNNRLAKEIAEISLYQSWEERKTYQFTLLPKYSRLEATDLITVKANNINYPLQIVKTDMNRSGSMRIVGSHYNCNIYDFISNAEYNPTQYEIPEITASTSLELINAPPLPIDQSNNEPIIRFAIIRPETKWDGVIIYKSYSQTYDYQLFMSSKTASIIGTTENKLPKAASTILDERSELIIKLIHGNLNSINLLTLLNGANRALIGDELIQFQNAELISKSTYKLSKLLRGKCGTEWAINTHQNNERFILLDNSLSARVVNADIIDRPISYKAVTIGNPLAETEAQEFTCYDNNLKPFAPVHAEAKITANNNININWIRRARHNNGWRNKIDVPLDEIEEKYEIDIIHNDKIIETLETTVPNITYFNHQKLQKLSANIYQISSIVGRGYSSNINLN